MDWTCNRIAVNVHRSALSVQRSALIAPSSVLSFAHHPPMPPSNHSLPQRLRGLHNLHHRTSHITHQASRITHHTPRITHHPHHACHTTTLPSHHSPKLPYYTSRLLLYTTDLLYLPNHTVSCPRSQPPWAFSPQVSLFQKNHSSLSSQNVRPH
ncbi:hypothetical protein BU24DRAFT_150838 [Aaosphaeria arxii CBS 175.79]|uniref:Uncharacterized protein n=1 Tax=Aaosphaeria arxii CBS 175.79 TaxID=1450172 RepID=A0A6A5XX15_9PLEO|nr:uncharacterized protein BU24DRAFT_150838 [Aaosphaeria arxii CBS 175.79]KAF2017443.1 hypothetical protein BU24DRAFT_150838 [Aaosphaeria arxii CBS 175.79]